MLPVNHQALYDVRVVYNFGEFSVAQGRFV